MMVFVGSLLTLKQVWNLGDAALAFMTFPNLIAIIILSTKLKDISTKYYNETYKRITYVHFDDIEEVQQSIHGAEHIMSPIYPYTYLFTLHSL